MHVLMLSMDTLILTQAIGNSRSRHEAYAARAGRISMVICNRRSPGLEAYRSERVSAQPTQSRSYLHYLWDGYQAGLHIHLDCPVDLITSQDPFLTGLIGLALRRRLKVPLLMQDHSSLLDNPYFAAESRRNAGLQRLARWTISRADAVRVVNDQERLACIRHGVPANHVCVIPVAANIAQFLNDPPAVDVNRWRERLGLTPEMPVALWAGRPVPVKNLPLLLQSFQRVHADMPDARLILVGDMGNTDVANQIVAAGLTSVVLLPGAVAHAELPALYAAATVYARSSNYEGFGVVLAEAFAAALPFVSTATADAQQMITNGETGYVVPIGDADALAKALIAVLSDPARSRAMGERARQHVRDVFDEQHLIDRWIGIWRAVAARQPLSEDGSCAS